MEEVTVIDLLKEDDCVIGAITLDENGDMINITADSTILATGGGTRVYDISTNSSSGTGDGYAMGYRAGVSLSIWKWYSFTRQEQFTRTMHEAGLSRKLCGEREAS